MRSSLTQVAAALLGFSEGEMTLFLVVGHSLAGVSFFSPHSLLEGHFFPIPDSLGRTVGTVGWLPTAELSFLCPDHRE